MTGQPHIPNEATARAIVADVLDWQNAKARRFTTGLAYYVFDIEDSGENVVLRIGLPDQAEAMAEGLALWQRLNPLGVPLPAVIAHGINAGLPFVIMTRLEGTDLGNVMAGLDSTRLAAIAVRVADAQLATARLGPAPGFGFAARPETTPHRRWSDVIAAGIRRSVERIAANGLYPVSVAAPVLERFERQRPLLDAMAPTPFLHDTTTKNVIVTATGQFSGIVDVDDLCFGDPPYAPALTRAALLAFGAGPASYVDPWMHRMQLQQDAVFSFYVAELLLNFMSEHGMSFNGNPGPSDPAMREHLVALLAHTLDEAP